MEFCLVHPNEFSSWKAPLEGEAAEVFGPRAGNGAVLAVVDVKSLHAKIGEESMKKPAKRAKSKPAAKARKRKSERSAKAIRAKSKTKSKSKSKASTKRRTRSKERPATQAEPAASLTIPKTRSSLKEVAKKAVAAAIVAAGVAAVDTALGELNSEKKAPADPRSDSEKSAQRDSDDSESTR